VRGCECAKKIREVVPPHPLPFSPMGRREIVEAEKGDIGKGRRKLKKISPFH
jgi:hypothetical protein